MIENRQVIVLPWWRSKCHFTSLSRILAEMEDMECRYILARTQDTRTYLLFLSYRGTCHFEFFALPRSLWYMAMHFTQVRAEECGCWGCRWRKRSRQFNSWQFTHLLCYTRENVRDALGCDLLDTLYDSNPIGLKG